MLAVLIWCASSPLLARPLTIDDVLATVFAERATISPDGETIAVVVQRPADDGEVYGREAYEITPTRSDIWLISRRSGAKRNLTNGAKLAAGFWCPHWSPDGRRLAMLSTKPEGREPRGGDNVRLYVWDRQIDKLQRMGNWAAMAQTRYGHSWPGLDLRGSNGKTGVCSPGFEKAPFVWLDDTQLIAAALPHGQVSTLLDATNRPFDHAAAVQRQISEGRVATFTADGSGAARIARDEQIFAAQIRLVDASRRTTEIVATVPGYPFQGGLGLSVSPDRQRLVVLATTGIIHPSHGAKGEEWLAERKLGIAAMASNSEMLWINLPSNARYPKEIVTWSPDSRSVTLLARSNPAGQTADPFTVSAKDGSVISAAVPAEPPGENVAGPKATRPVELTGYAELLDSVPSRNAAVWRETTRSGSRIVDAQIDGSQLQRRIELNSHLAKVDWGKTQAISYAGLDGQPLRGLVVLPPDYDPAKRYPLLVWVYPGTLSRNFAYWNDPYLPGFYNLQLYAARGYVVVVPSMPRGAGTQLREIQAGMQNGVLPAVDRLVEMGIADPNRVGVFGQSLGGYAVNSLITQTNRFKAAIAIAGNNDLAQSSFQFDPLARGYPGIEHEKSVNWDILEQGFGLGASPIDDPELYRRNSPLFDAKKIETPLLLIHGEFDARGGFPQAEAMFNSLSRQNKTARLLRYWGESHSLAQSPANVRSVFGEIVEWFDIYLKAGQ